MESASCHDPWKPSLCWAEIQSIYSYSWFHEKSCFNPVSYQETLVITSDTLPPVIKIHPSKCDLWNDLERHPNLTTSTAFHVDSHIVATGILHVILRTAVKQGVCPMSDIKIVTCFMMQRLRTWSAWSARGKQIILCRIFNIRGYDVYVVSTQTYYVPLRAWGMNQQQLFFQARIVYHRGFIPQGMDQIYVGPQTNGMGMMGYYCRLLQKMPIPGSSVYCLMISFPRLFSDPNWISLLRRQVGCQDRGRDTSALSRLNDAPAPFSTHLWWENRDKLLVYCWFRGWDDPRDEEKNSSSMFHLLIFSVATYWKIRAVSFPNQLNS